MPNDTDTFLTAFRRGDTATALLFVTGRYAQEKEQGVIEAYTHNHDDVAFRLLSQLPWRSKIMVLDHFADTPKASQVRNDADLVLDTGLYYAAVTPAPNAARFLMRLATVAKQMEGVSHAAYAAAQENHPEILAILHPNGLSEEEKEGLFFPALQGGATDVLRFLHPQGLSIEKNKRAISAACANKNIPLLDYLLSTHASPAHVLNEVALHGWREGAAHAAATCDPSVVHGAFDLAKRQAKRHTGGKMAAEILQPFHENIALTAAVSYSFRPSTFRKL